MDDLLNDFLLETAEALPLVEAELVAFEADPARGDALKAVLQAVHTVRDASGVLRFRRLQAVAGAAESLLVRFGETPAAATPGAVGLVLQALDAIRDILSHLELVGAEPAGDDLGLIAALQKAASPGPAAVAAGSGVGAMRLTTTATAHPRGPVTAPVRVAKKSSDALPPPATAPEPTQRVARVDAEVLDDLSAGVRELVRTRNQLLELLPGVDDPALRAPLQRLSVITGELEDGMARARLEPIGAAWRALPRTVRDLSQGLGKDIEFRLDGGSVEVDRELVAALKVPLTHLVRNAADHGVEPPQDRVTAGKPAASVIKLAAWTEGEELLIRVSDDGRGLDADAIRHAAVADGWLSPAEAAVLSEAQIHRLVFVPGLTTLGGSAEVLGRGVGLDAVRAAVQRLGGRISVRSTPGRGTAFTLRLPLERERSSPGQAGSPIAQANAPAGPVSQPPRPAGEAPPPASRRILLIEGSAFLRHMMTPLLTAAGYQVTAASSTEDAWRLHAAGTEFDAIVSDLDSSGEGFAQRLDDSRWSAAPRIALTDLPPAETPAPGFAEVVRKSDRQGLIAVLSGALGSHSSGECAA